MTSARSRLGRWGEAQARLRLEAQGYRVLATNYRCLQGEIDIIVMQGKEIVFVEVKTRRGGDFGLPEESITPAKASRLTAAAQHYLQTQLPDGQASEAVWRIDLISIYLDKRGKLLSVKHLENAIEG